MKKLKSIVALLVVVIMLPSFCFAVDTDRYMNAFEYLTKDTEADGEFVTRGECVSVILRIVGMTRKDAYDAVYNTAYDEPPFFEYECNLTSGYIACAYSCGVTNGASGRVFAPDRSVTLKECLTFILRCLSEPELVKWENVMQDSVKAGLLSEEELAEYDENLLLDRDLFYTLVSRMLDKKRHFYIDGETWKRKIDIDKGMRYITWVEEKIASGV